MPATMKGKLPFSLIGMGRQHLKKVGQSRLNNFKKLNTKVSDQGSSSTKDEATVVRMLSGIPRVLKHFSTH